MVVGTRVNQFFDFDCLQPDFFVPIFEHEFKLVDALVLLEHMLIEHLLLELEQLLVFAIPLREEARLLLEGVDSLLGHLIDLTELVVYC